MRDPRRAAASDFVIPFPNALFDNQVRRSGFVFERHKRDPFGGRRPLSQDHQTGHPQLTVVGFLGQPAAAGDF